MDRFRFQGWRQAFDQNGVEGRRGGPGFRQQAMVPHCGGNFRLMEDGGKIQSAGFPMIDGGGHLQAVHPADHVGHRVKSQCGHNAAQILGHEAHEIDQMSGTPGELLAQLRILGGDAHRASIQVADPHHDAPQAHQGHRTETEFLGPQEGRHGHVPGGLQLAVGLHHHAVPQAVLLKHLACFRQTQFPGQPAVADRGLGRGPGAAYVAADEHHVGPGLGHPCGNRADPRLGNKFDAHPGGRIGHLEIVDQLGQVLDGIDIVVGWRRDESHIGRAVAGFGDPGVDFASGQLSPSPGLAPWAILICSSLAWVR